MDQSTHTNFCLLGLISIPHSISSRPTPSPLTYLLHPPKLCILRETCEQKVKVKSRTTVHPHPHTHSLLNLQHNSFSHGDSSKTPPSLTQPRPYLVSCTPQHPLADTHRGLHFSDRWPAPFVSCLFMRGHMGVEFRIRKHVELKVNFPVSVRPSIFEKND